MAARRHLTFLRIKVKANHPKEVRRKEGAIVSVWRWKMYYRGREAAGREALQ